MNRFSIKTDSPSPACGKRSAVVSVEILLVAVVAIVGLLVGLVAVRDSLISELSDVSGAVQDSVQSYAVNGASSGTTASAGMDFIDQLDVSDDVDDIAGLIDNQISVDVAPASEGFAVSTEELVAELLFNGNASDSSPFGNSNDGALVNGATIVGGQLVLDGVDDFVTIANSPDINTGSPVTERTIHVEFTPNDVVARQLIYEEGGGVRGLNIYIDNGLLYLGGYNIPETGYAPTFVTAPIVAGQTFSATIVLNAGASVAPDSFSGFLNGSLVGRTSASQIFGHAGGIGVGGVNGRTVFHDGTGSGAFFNGSIDSVSIYNRSLSDGEVSGL
jgi:hypothetical protein